jgi:phage tail-like protein
MEGQHVATSLSRYVQHLPPFFQDDPFVARFLLSFERILTGFPAADPSNFPSVPLGIEQVLDRIQTYFDPATTPADFLPWLAEWVATSLREDWDEQTRRSFIAQIVPLYRRRGTTRALKMLLQIYLNPSNDPSHDPTVEVIDNDPAFPRHYFLVRFRVNDQAESASVWTKQQIAIEIINREKPAHTYFGLDIVTPSLEIANPPTFDVNHYPTTGVFVGINTRLGTKA